MNFMGWLDEKLEFMFKDKFLLLINFVCEQGHPVDRCLSIPPEYISFL